MTTAPHQSQLARTPEAASSRRAAPEVRVEWAIAPEALHAARPDLDIRRDAHRCALVWTIGSGGDARATLEIDGSPLAFSLAPAPLGADVSHHAPTETVAITVPGLLELVIDAAALDGTLCSEDSPQGRMPARSAVLYARTTLLGALGLPGGSYRLAIGARAPDSAS